MNEASKSYCERKTGRNQSLSWIIKSYLPSLLIVFIMVVLVFALIFVSSMSKAIEDTLVYLGSGNITAYSSLEDIVFKEDEKVFEVSSASAMIASSSSTALINLKGVGSDYFFEEKVDKLNLETVENNTTLNSVYLSKTIANSLSVSLGDKVSVLIFDKEEGRARPVYCFISGLYHSGYGEFDSHLAFAPRKMVDGNISYEIYTSREDEVLKQIKECGIKAASYKTIYYSIYENIIRSVSLLDAIVILVGILAGFFSISISSEYVERDRRDIAGILLLGVKKDEVINAYRKITINVVNIALVVGCVLGIALSYLIIPLLSSLDSTKYPFLSNYVLSFNVSIPITTILLLCGALILSSVISLRFSLKKMIFSDIKAAL
ncbi:ABC transporter permease [Bullifex sp.]|uniref:ABC transporter permease n=1 Tax=Bullifex sp. TaxID=2815808 RepID=UPI002A82F427|nr:FtsX-like permease family protein [Bullifex sp.]MDY4067237.1 FtsX-like permease family protein [Bullifex sp.]